MTDPIHQQLLGHLLGALDDDEQERVDAQLEGDAESCRALGEWRRRLAPLEMLRPEFEPPPGLVARTCRFVAACMPAASDVLSSRRRMSPDLTPPIRRTGYRWCDVAAVALLLVTTGALLLPAIYSSRFHARLAECQNGLHQYGATLARYGHDHGRPISRLARNGQLTRANVWVDGQVQEGFLTDHRHALRTDAWLAAQAASPNSPSAEIQLASLENANSAARDVTVPRFASSAPLKTDNWPGTWRDGTTNDWRLSVLPAAVPLQATAPSADLPGHILPSQGTRGRNLLFDDGHVSFVKGTTSDGAGLFFVNDATSNW